MTATETTLYRIKLVGKPITYQQTQANVVNFQSQTKHNKRALVAFIRDFHFSATAREIINGDYKAIKEDNFLIGIQYKLKSK